MLRGDVCPAEERPVTADRHDQVGRGPVGRLARALTTVTPSARRRRSSVPRRATAAAPTLVHDESDDAHPDRPSPSVDRRVELDRCIIHPAAPVEQELHVARPDRGAGRRRRRARRLRAPGTPRRPRARTRRQTAGSRTTPPLPTSAGPASNCGLTSTTNSASWVATSTSAGSTDRSEMNDRSATTRSGTNGRSAGVQGAHVRAFHHRDARVVADLPRELAVAHVDRDHPRRARPAAGSR